MSRTVQEDIFGLRGTPQRMLEVLANMHQESPDRWTPRRLMLANWWLFDEPQEILFGRGNLMLTGKNESGKSTVLITIATLVLDRLLEPVRIDTTGGGDRTVRYAQDVKRAYRRLALEWHPDRNSAPEAAERFQIIADAYAILSDPQKSAPWHAAEADARIQYVYDGSPLAWDSDGGFPWDANDPLPWDSDEPLPWDDVSDLPF